MRKLGFFKNILNDAKKEREISAKMREATKQKEISSEASKLKKEFNLSDDEAEFMAKKSIAKKKRGDSFNFDLPDFKF